MPSFTNSAGLTLIDGSLTSQTLAVATGSSGISRITVTLTGLTHGTPDSLDFLLVAPDGTHNLLFWSDAGGSLEVSNGTFTIADAGGAPLPDAAQLVSGTTYQPADHPGTEADADFGAATGGINAAGPNGAATFASAFNGIDPNGLWTLYALYDGGGEQGSLASWSLNILNDVAITGTGGVDTLVVTATGANAGTYSLNGAPAVAFADITALSFSGLGDDDVLTIINPGDGLLAVPVSYDGGGQSGDALELLEGTGTATTYTATGVSSGSIAHLATEAHLLSVTGPGTFTLTFDGQTTAALPFDATAAAIESALNALSSIGGAGASVTVTPSGAGHVVTFGGTLAATALAQMSATGSGGASVNVSTLMQGGTQTVSFTGLASITDTVTEGSYTLVGTSGADSITITDGGMVGGEQTWLISSATFESVRIANKTTLIIDGNGGGDTVSMDTSVTAAGLQHLQIRNVGTVTETGAFSLQSLRIQAANSVTLNNVNDVDIFSAQVSGLNGTVAYRDGEGFTVDGIGTNGGAVTLATDSGNLVVGSATPNSGIATGAGNTVRLQATTGNVSQTAAGTIASDALGVRAGGSVALTTAVNDNGALAISANGLVEYRDAGDVTISTIAGSGIFTAQTAGVASGSNDINLQSGGNLVLNDGLPGAASIDAGSADVRIVSGGTIDQVVGGDNILADELGIIAGGAVALARAGSDVNTIAIAASGPVEFRNFDALTVAAVAAGGSAGFTGASGITSENGDVALTVFADVLLAQSINAGTGAVGIFSIGLNQNASGAIVAAALGINDFGPVVDLSGSSANDVDTLAISTTGAVAYRDSDDLRVGSVAGAGFATVTGVSGGSITVTTASRALTVANNVTATSTDVVLQAGDSAAAGDDLIITAGVTIKAVGNIALWAGDDLNLHPGSSIAPGTFVDGAVDFGNADPGTGGTAILDGTSAPGGDLYSGQADDDTFFSAVGPDLLQGLDGNDRLVWAPGDGEDTFDGGAGIDTLALIGAAGDETFALDAAGARAVLLRSPGSETVTTTNAERLELAAGGGANAFTVADLSATALTGLIAYAGGSGVDTIGASAAVNPFDVLAGSGDDLIATGAGADRLRGEAGDDLMNGGAGNDTAVYAARAADYQLSFLGGNARVSDLRAGAPDGTDTLRAIENLELVDATLAILSGTDGDDGFTAAGNQVIAGGAGTDTITFGFRLVDATITWLGHSVMIQTASSHTVLGGFDIYVFTDGTVQNNDADILVDDLFYYANNHDVWAAQADADQHYHQTGRHALRDPNAFFDTSLYLDAYSDVKVAGVDPLLHFAGSGWQEGRIPSLAFDPRQYRDANPDVASAQVDPLAHFLRFGVPEERLPFAPTTLIGASGFDYVFYLQSNPDVAAADVDPLAHFRSIGWREGRDPNALFDVEGYRAAYADVAAAGVDPLDHYNQFGWREGRDPSGAFDTRFYLDTHADVAAAQVNPLQHYLQFGVHEGRAILSDGVFG